MGSRGVSGRSRGANGLVWWVFQWFICRHICLYTRDPDFHCGRTGGRSSEVADLKIIKLKTTIKCYFCIDGEFNLCFLLQIWNPSSESMVPCLSSCTDQTNSVQTTMAKYPARFALVLVFVGHICSGPSSPQAVNSVCWCWSLWTVAKTAWSRTLSRRTATQTSVQASAGWDLWSRLQYNGCYSITPSVQSFIHFSVSTPCFPLLFWTMTQSCLRRMMTGTRLL